MRDDKSTQWLQPKPLPSWANEDHVAQQIESSLSASAPIEKLTELVYQWFAEGFDEGEALGALNRYRERLENEDRAEDDDVIVEVISCLVGWCGPDGLIRRKS